MTYEIPQQLEYREKILFGLDFKQLAWLFLFSFIALIVLKMPIGFSLQFIMEIIVSAIAFGFIFLDLHSKIKSWISWYSFREIRLKKNLKEFSGIKEIKDNMIITTENRKLAILKIEPINFSIKPLVVQETIIQSFQKFLNSLDFPIQIIMDTESLNLKEYLKDLESRIKGNNEFKDIFKEYKEHLEKTIQQRHVLNRNFYLVIPEKDNLEIQVELCQKKLENIGLKSSRIDSSKIFLIFKKFFNSEDIFPEKIKNDPNSIKIGNLFNRVIYAHGYPRTVDHGFLDRIVSLLGDFDLSLHIEPYDLEATMIQVNRELQKQRADLYSADIRGIVNPSLEIKYEDTRNILDNLQKGREKLFNVSLYINCRAETKESLDLISKRVESELNSLLIIPKYPSFKMIPALQSCSPIVKNILAMKRNVPTRALSAFFPFTSSFLQADLSGIWLGLNKNNIPIIKDIFKLSNPNGFCLASSGAGKSYMTKLFISRHLLHGTKVIVLDPQGEYRNLVQMFHGKRIDLSRNSETIINPMDLMGHDYHEKRLALMDLMPIMLGPMTDPQKSFIDRAITESYAKKAITSDPKTWNREPPILGDVLDCLKIMEKKAVKIEEPTVRSLINRLDMYVNGVFSFLNRQTRINFNNRFVCFDIGNLPKQVKPTLMFLVLDFVYMKMRQDLERKILVIDEAWSLLSRAEDASYIFEIVKTCRKFNLALFLINQEVEGMANTEAGKSVLANSSYTILMRQKPAVIEDIQEAFHLSNAERTFLLTAAVGEGILIMDDEHSEIKIVASEREHKEITTNPDEILKNNPTKEQKKDLIIKRLESVSIKVNLEKNLFRTENLSINDIEYLLGKGYKEITQYNIDGKIEKYLIRTKGNESAKHGFLVYNIAEFLESKKYKFKLHTSTNPDLVFQMGKKEYAIEVETGVWLRKNINGFKEKVRQLYEKFEDRWVFVVTDRGCSKEYNKYRKTFIRGRFKEQFESWMKNCQNNCQNNCKEVKKNGKHTKAKNVS